jgi:hypothetical protein
MRWALKYTDLKPRAYYARGPDQHFASRYIQAIFNKLIDLFPCTHRRHRFITDNIRVSEDESFFIYDYSAFTSTFHEVNNFIAALARFFEGTPITVVDTFQGAIRIDLGHYLTQYLEVCNRWAEFDISMANPDRIYSDDEVIYHNTGMLGVPGNITSCTLGHGLHLSVIVGSLVLSRCIGDDAIGRARDLDFQTEIVPLLENIGIISLKKCEEFDGSDDVDEAGDDGRVRWNYEKRPILRVAGRVVRDRMVMFPPTAALLGFEDTYHTSFEVPVTRKAAKLRNAFTSLLVHLDPAFFPLDEDQKDMIRRIIAVHIETFIRDRYQGKGSRGEKTPDFIIHLRAQKAIFMNAPFGPSFFDYWWSHTSCDVLEIPKQYVDEDLLTERAVYRGLLYSTRSHPMWSLLRKMGWAEVEEQMILVPVSEVNRQHIRDWFFKILESQYHVVLFQSCPQYMIDAINNHILRPAAPQANTSSGSSESSTDSE